ncbi:MAG: phage holin family protein [Deltaproteobacteria bacterium]|nr:MAG: phage holin family protein [Deltaproteobacteria bacterium]
MVKFLLHWFGLALALWLTAWLLPGVELADRWALLFGTLALGFVNALVRPVLLLITLPLTVLTLGVFYLVVNGVSFALAAWLVPGFTVSSWWQAILGALVCGLLSWLIGVVTGKDREPTQEAA